MENTNTTRFSLGFRLLARVEGRRWLSRIKRKTPNAAVPTGNHPPPQTTTSQSRLNSDTTSDLPTNKDQTKMIDDVAMFQSTINEKEPIKGTHNTQTIVVTDDSEDDEQQKGKNRKKVRNIIEKVSKGRNHIREEIKDLGQRRNILEEGCEIKRSRKSADPIIIDQSDDDEDEPKKKHAKQVINEQKRKNPMKQCSIETQLRKDHRREVLLARLRARIEKSEARLRTIMNVEE
ncbi:hypothetical protein L1887_07239 [Cichorium endivia]|nr:hypothetical protein L1887_07239 [Cichorium endivia]